MALVFRREVEERWDAGNVVRLLLLKQWKIEEKKNLKVRVVVTEKIKDG